MIDDKDLTILDEIVFVLTDRTKPTLVVISTGSYHKRNTLRQALNSLLPDYAPERLDLSGQSIVSLAQVIRDQAPEHVLSSTPVTCLLHIDGLEDSLYVTQDGHLGSSPLVAELNLERETLFHEFPCCLIIWTTPFFTDKLKKEAPDLWDWITYHYHFPDDRIESGAGDIPDIPEEPDGMTEERAKRIQDLEDRLTRLRHDADGPERTARKKYTLYKALGQEFLASFRPKEAIRSFNAALALLGDTDHRETDKAELFFLLGTACLSSRDFTAAHAGYNTSLIIQEKAGLTENIGNTWHQIGMVYQEQRNWDCALDSYRKAMEWDENNRQSHSPGITWHQIGMVYEKQRNWNQALDSYNKALEWKKKTGQSHLLGGTWYQIGMVYQKQRNWDRALDSYCKALESDEETGQNHQLGRTWHQIGTVYQVQLNWDRAMDSYHKALEWKKKTGQSHLLGSTWYQIGMVYEGQGDIAQSFSNYEKAFDLARQAGINHLEDFIIKSLTRLFPRLSKRQKRSLKNKLPNDIYRQIENP